MSTLSFDDLSLPDALLHAIFDMGYDQPTPIQAGAIPPLLEGRDIVGIAQTGTGKTAAFGLPLLTHVDPQSRHVQALVLAPTRELAIQSAKAMGTFAAHCPGISIVTVYGGASYVPQLRALKDGAQIVVGTPGRIIDLIEKGALNLTQLRMLVLDEADEMLRMGFADDVETIAATAPEPGERITALFSATMPPAIERVAREHLIDPVDISVAPQASTAENLEQTYAIVPFKHKLGALSRVLWTRTEDAAIVFVRTRADADEVSADLTQRGFKAAGISGDVSQSERERIVSRLRDGSLDVLVATDVAARGLDVERLGLVINFDVPREAEAYVHRVGRTGRAGREGRALTFFTPRERSRLRAIERLIDMPLVEVAIPTPREVSEFQARRLLTTLPERIKSGRLELYFELLAEMSDTTGIHIEDVAAALLAQAVGDRGPDSYHDQRGTGRVRREETVDDNGVFVSASFEEGRDAKKRKSRRGGARPVSSGFSRRYRIEVGHRDGVKPGAIVGAITGEGGVTGSDLGKIDIFPNFSLVELSGELSDQAAGRIGRATIGGRRLRIREDTGPSRDHRAGKRRARSY
ncbi:MAG: DEAD/DEAH box helicase [Actinomycetaceae bacterium]|nr:DEAD/DEAH box helicase [Actinomycetaceae bacterium]